MNGFCDCTCHAESGVMHIVPCCHPCEGCGANVPPLALREHMRGCVAVQARPLVLAAVRVADASAPIFHVDHFREVVWEAFATRECPSETWGHDCLARLPYVARVKGDFYRYEAAPVGPAGPAY